MLLIKKYREKAGITQVELASELGVSQPSLALWEAGTTNPKTERVPSIADALGCTIDQLFGRGEVDDIS